MGWELGSACTGRVCQFGISVSSACSVCPGSVPLLHLLPRASQVAGTAAGVWCHALQEFMLCTETVAPVCIQHMRSAMKKHIAEWLLVFPSCLGIEALLAQGR